MITMMPKSVYDMNAKLFEKILSQEMTGILKGKSAFSRRT
jgi:hypothetical protein